MKECAKCKNYIPDDIGIFPHCETIATAWLRLLFGLVLCAAVGIATSAFLSQRGIGELNVGELEKLKFLVVTVFAIPLALWGIFSIKRALKRVIKTSKLIRYKKHSDHDFTNSCYCTVCGKLNEHDWNGCKCKRCGKTRDEQHAWNGCKCRICGKVEHDWIVDPIWCKCAKCGQEKEHDLVFVESHEEYDGLYRETAPYGDSVTTVYTYECKRCGQRIEK